MKTTLAYFFVLWLTWPATVSAAQTVVNVSAGENHTLFLKSDGSLWAAGSNQNGQLGDGTLNDTNTPELIVPGGVTAIAAGGYHSLFIKSDGSLWAMGYNLDGQLGDGGYFATNKPEMIVSNGVAAVAAGLYQSLFIKTNGSLWAMGYNIEGQLGDGTLNTRTNQPEMIVPGGVMAISAGNSYDMFLKTNGSLWVMGYSNDGQLGDGIANNQTNLPEMIVASNVVAIAAGSDHALFVTSDGAAWDMGDNYFGELGDGIYNNSDVPVRNPTLNTNVMTVGGGEFYSVFLKSDGSLWGTGETAYGQLGDGTTSLFRAIPEMIVSSNVTLFSSGLDHTMFLKSDHTVWGMGHNFFGELGDGTTNVALVPVQIVLPATPQFGALQVTLSPVGVISAGAQWQVDGGTFQNSGVTVTGLAAGSHTVAFKTIAGWVAPASQNVDISAGITNPATGVYTVVDVTKPSVSITAPTANERWSNSTFTVSGKASDNVAVASVFVSLNEGAWTQANGGSNWLEQVGLVPGTNTIAAYAVDTSGNFSPTNKVSLLYILSTVLTVGTNGGGTITPGDNGALLQLGGSYLLTAKALTGFAFTNWTDGLGDVITNGAGLKFIMASNLTFVANFLDIAKPTLTITNPAKTGELWSNALFTVSGKCSDNVAVSNIMVSLNAGAWMTATLPNGSNWLEHLPALTPGTNTIAAYAVDTSGNLSATNTLKLVYILTSALTVITNGGGTVITPDKGAKLQIGAVYSLTAKALTGFVFTNWTDGLGNVITNGAVLKFVMASNLTFVANFLDIAKPTLTITNPAKTGELWSNALFTVSGKCSDNVAVSNIMVSLNAGAWMTATLPNGSNWLEHLPALTPGTNTIAAYAVDTSGNLSATNNLKLVYIVNTTTIIGSWNLVQFETPAQIYLDASNNLQGGGSFTVTNGSLTFNTNGIVSGTLGDDFTGAYIGDSNGVINVIITNETGTMPLTFYLNAPKDTMTEVDSEFDEENNQQEIVVGHRIPASVSAAALAGSWNVIQFQTPVQIIDDMNNGLSGGTSFGVTNGTLTLNANGTFSGKVKNAVSGTFTVSSNGVITLNPTASGSQPLTFYLNFTKDTMTAVTSQFDANDNQQQLVVCHRIPASVVLADLVGSWNLVQFGTPAQITNDVSNTLQGGGNFAVTNGTLTVNANGTISGTLSDTFTGNLTVGTKGVIQLHIVAGGGGGSQTFTFYLNAGKDTLTEVDSQLDPSNNQQQLVVAHRVPAD